MQNLDAVKTKWLEAVAAAASPAALEDVRVKALGKKGEVTALMKGLGALSPDERREAGAKLNARQGRGRRRDRGAQGGARRGRARRAPEDRARRRHPAGAARARGPPPPDQPDHRRDRRDLRRDGLPRRRRAGHRGRLPQLHRAQHPARASGAADARHVLSAGRRRHGRPGGKLLRTHTSPVQIRTMKARSRRSASSRRAAPIASTPT